MHKLFWYTKYVYQLLAYDDDFLSNVYYQSDIGVQKSTPEIHNLMEAQKCICCCIFVFFSGEFWEFEGWWLSGQMLGDGIPNMHKFYLDLDI